MCVRIFVLKTAQNLERLRLVSSIHIENNKNDKRVLSIVIQKILALIFAVRTLFSKLGKHVRN